MASRVSPQVNVIGTGRMGSALATALFRAGFPTTVWNRSASRTEPLARIGLRVAKGLGDAVSAGIIIANVVDYPTTRKLLCAPDVASALAGKTLVQLASGTPHEAREMEAWAKGNKVFYLDGAIMSDPSGVGTAGATLFFSGPKEIFDRVKPVLSALGGNSLLVGSDVGHASALDIAGINLFLGAMFAFMQGYILCEQEGMPTPQFAGQRIDAGRARHPRTGFATAAEARFRGYCGNYRRLEYRSQGDHRVVEKPPD